MSKCKILSTKKLPPAFHSALPENIDLQEIEFIQIQQLPLPVIVEEISRLALTSNKVGIVFTSSNAVTDISSLWCKHEQPMELDIFCLGGATVETVKERLADMPVVAVADNGRELAMEIISKNAREVIFFCGNKRRDELPDLLKQQGVIVHQVIVYNTELNPVKVSGEFDAVLYFSPSGVESFFSCNTLSDKATCITIGSTTAKAISEYAPNDVIVCEHPTRNCLLAAIKEFNSKKKMNNDIEK